MDNFDLRIREFSDAIIKYINNALLPLEVKRLVTLEICQKLQEESDKAIISQIREREQNGEGISED